MCFFGATKHGARQNELKDIESKQRYIDEFQITAVDPFFQFHHFKVAQYHSFQGGTHSPNFIMSKLFFLALLASFIAFLGNWFQQISSQLIRELLFAPDLEEFPKSFAGIPFFYLSDFHGILHIFQKNHSSNLKSIHVLPSNLSISVPSWDVALLQPPNSHDLRRPYDHVLLLPIANDVLTSAPLQKLRKRAKLLIWMAPCFGWKCVLFIPASSSLLKNVGRLICGEEIEETVSCRSHYMIQSLMVNLG